MTLLGEQTTLGPYRLLRRLGAGGMAEVFLARSFGASGFEKQIAIKTLLPELQDNAKLVRLLIEEAKLAARLQHRNLVQVHDLGVVAGVYYVRMDYVDGADLRTLLKKRHPPLALSLLIAEEIALALEFVHSVGDDEGRPLGLVHRDISPSNILVSRFGEVKLADFGIAKATMLVDITQSNVRKGKYTYMSPEQVSGVPLTAASDQFSLGITLTELVTGQRPFDGDSPLETMDLIRQAKPPVLQHKDSQDIDEDLDRLIHRCLAKQPTERFASSEELRAAIAKCRITRPAAAPDLARWVQETMAEV